VLTGYHIVPHLAALRVLFPSKSFCMKKIVLLILFFLPALIMLAQNRTITGKVTNPDGKPVSLVKMIIAKMPR
jgi:hypothetical protein